MTKLLPGYLHRRQVIRWLALAAAGQHLGAKAWQQAKPGVGVFSLGVASGAATHDSVVLWTRLYPDNWHDRERLVRLQAVRWEVSHNEQFTQLVQSGTVNALPELAHSVHVDVRGLAPDRWYFYRFRTGDAVSRTGRTRTFAPPGAPTQALRLAYASCQKWEDGYFSAYQHMERDNPDAVVFLGDYLYEYPGNSSKVRVPGGGWVQTLDEYRRRHALYKGDAHLQAMHATAPWWVTWDDHEVQNDYAGTTPGDGGPPGWQIIDFAQRRASAYQAYYEHMPVRAPEFAASLLTGQTGHLQMHGQIHLGNLASLSLLDTRQYRDVQVCTKEGKGGSGMVDPDQCAAWDDPTRSLLGSAQEQWLYQRLAQTRQTTAPRWNLIGQQTLFCPRDLRPGQQRFFWNDGWDGYPSARQRLLHALQHHQVPNAVFLGGDVHENWVGHVLPTQAKAHAEPLAVEFCGTSITSKSGRSNERLPTVLAENPHFVFADVERKGYGLLDITHQQLKAQLRVVDDVTQRQTQIETLAAFEVEAGRARLHRSA